MLPSEASSDRLRRLLEDDSSGFRKCCGQQLERRRSKALLELHRTHLDQVPGAELVNLRGPRRAAFQKVREARSREWNLTCDRTKSDHRRRAREASEVTTTRRSQGMAVKRHGVANKLAKKG